MRVLTAEQARERTALKQAMAQAIVRVSDYREAGATCEHKHGCPWKTAECTIVCLDFKVRSL